LPYICISEEEKIHAKKKGLPGTWQTLNVERISENRVQTPFGVCTLFSGF
jgi:hypothetical protein